MDPLQIVNHVPPLTRGALLKFDIIVNTLNAPGWYDIPRNCNGFMITNTGNATCEVNNQILYPGTIGTLLGDSKSFGGNYGEIYVGKLKLAFGAGALPALEVAFKIYTNIPD